MFVEGRGGNLPFGQRSPDRAAGVVPCRAGPGATVGDRRRIRTSLGPIPDHDRYRPAGPAAARDELRRGDLAAADLGLAASFRVTAVDLPRSAGPERRHPRPGRRGLRTAGGSAVLDAVGQPASTLVGSPRGRRCGAVRGQRRIRRLTQVVPPVVGARWMPGSSRPRCRGWRVLSIPFVIVCLTLAIRN
ncbi:hypothetical protein HBB16_03855, partial [Pseudonocardia sp. MCCB 268]|nr:hypothetical protein [Pseudonocardia cytotoxica]